MYIVISSTLAIVIGHCSPEEGMWTIILIKCHLVLTGGASQKWLVCILHSSRQGPQLPCN